MLVVYSQCLRCVVVVIIVIWDSAFHWTWGLQNQIQCAVSMLQVSSCLHLAMLGFLVSNTSSDILTECWGSKHRISQSHLSAGHSIHRSASSPTLNYTLNTLFSSPRLGDFCGFPLCYATFALLYHVYISLCVESSHGLTAFTRTFRGKAAR